MKPQRIYIITNPNYKKDNMYKIGYHTGSKKELKRTYHRAIVDLEIVRFTDSINCKQDEKDLHAIFAEYRVTGYEFFKINGQELLEKYDKFFADKRINVDYQSLVDIQNQIIKINEDNAEINKRINSLEEKLSEIYDILLKIMDAKSAPINNQTNIVNNDPIIIHNHNPTEYESFNSIDEFIDYIKTCKPNWFKAGQWQHQREIYDQFKSKMTCNIDTRTFSIKLRNRIFKEKRQMRMNGNNLMAFKLFNWDEIQ